MNPQTKFKRIAVVIVLGFAGPVAAARPDGQTPPSERILRKEATVTASLDELWHAWTTSEGIASFFSPESNIELRLGGPYELYMKMAKPDENGLRGTQGCKVLSFIPREMLAFEWNFPPSVPELRASGVKTQVVIRFRELADGRVKVGFAQLGWQEGADWAKGYEYFDQAWTYVFTQLEKRFEESSQSRSKPHRSPRPATPMKVSQVEHVTVLSAEGPEKYQAFEMEVAAPVADVWDLLASEEGFKRLGGKEPKLELRPGGAYSFWPGAPNKVLAFVPHEVLSTSGSAPPEFPNVRMGGTWSSYFFEPAARDRTRIRLVCVGWRPGEKEWDDAFDYFLKSNAQFLNQVYEALTARKAAAGASKDSSVILRHEIIVEAPIEAVWDAFTTTEGLESWMVAHAEIDLRVGGKMLTHYDPNGTLGDENTIENTILSYEPLRMLSIKATKAPASFPYKEAIKNMWSVVRFEPIDARRTRVVCTGMGYGEDEESLKLRSHFEAGNQWTLRALQSHFARGRSGDDSRPSASSALHSRASGG